MSQAKLGISKAAPATPNISATDHKIKGSPLRMFRTNEVHVLNAQEILNGQQFQEIESQWRFLFLFLPETDFSSPKLIE
jgi:hypothetical protein